MSKVNAQTVISCFTLMRGETENQRIERRIKMLRGEARKIREEIEEGDKEDEEY